MIKETGRGKAKLWGGDNVVVKKADVNALHKLMHLTPFRFTDKASRKAYLRMLFRNAPRQIEQLYMYLNWNQ